MRGSALAAVVATAVEMFASANARADLRPCAEKIIATLPEPDPTHSKRWLDRASEPIDFDARELAAPADKDDRVHAWSTVRDQELAAGERDRAARLVDTMEREATAKPPELESFAWPWVLSIGVRGDPRLGDPAFLEALCQ